MGQTGLVIDGGGSESVFITGTAGHTRGPHLSDIGIRGHQARERDPDGMLRVWRVGIIIWKWVDTQPHRPHPTHLNTENTAHSVNIRG